MIARLLERKRENRQFFLTALSFPYSQFGVIVLTTANGILDHEEARRKKVGGKVLGRVCLGCVLFFLALFHEHASEAPTEAPTDDQLKCRA